jgi:hypothetical protein
LMAPTTYTMIGISITDPITMVSRNMPGATSHGLAATDSQEISGMASLGIISLHGVASVGIAANLNERWVGSCRLAKGLGGWRLRLLKEAPVRLKALEGSVEH